MLNIALAGGSIAGIFYPLSIMRTTKSLSVDDHLKRKKVSACGRKRLNDSYASNIPSSRRLATCSRMHFHLGERHPHDDDDEQVEIV
ncbi:hypothetical protein M514_08105 [Trichuris suis]|uniref:Uncharacterized protein n=1 Tax=Trichuris suis TaxID=68888 RepID=A0A085M1G8_9BILA|nr:hypothetical protein M513_08105 [Trichuris suis]KFD73278.1 hypothetical protein M514_08105 [Trichuris suis]